MEATYKAMTRDRLWTRWPWPIGREAALVMRGEALCLIVKQRCRMRYLRVWPGSRL
jgi:hypothetical protein